MAFHYPSRCAPETLSFGETKSVLDVDGPFASSSLSTALRLLSDLVDLWGALPSASELFCHLSRFLPMLLEDDSMHPQLRKEAETLRDKLASLSSAGKRPIAKERSKPKILRQYEPEFDDRYTFRIAEDLIRDKIILLFAIITVYPVSTPW